MDNYIRVGKIINTFGIKGELKIISDFEYKDRIFKKGVQLFVGEFKYNEIINTHRVHKNYDLIIFEGYTNINEVLKYKGSAVYVLREELNLQDNEYLLIDLVGYIVKDGDSIIGKVIDYDNTTTNVLLKIKGDKTFYLPLINEYIERIDTKNRKISTKNGSDLIL